MSGKEVIRAPLMFTKAGRASKLNPTKEIAFGLSLGIAFGIAWEMYHANEKAKWAQFYAEYNKAKGGQ